MSDKQKRILVVDDEEDIVELVELILMDEGYQVQTSLDAENAKKILLEGEVDLVVTDIRMPGMSGVELLDWIKDQSLTKPVVMFISGFSDITPEEAFDRGACGYLKKPFEPTSLLNLVREALEGPAKFRRKYDRANVKLTVKMQSKSIDNLPNETHTINLGQGGMFICCEQFGKEKDLVEFEIEFNSGDLHIVQGVGEIVWQRKEEQDNMPKGIGIKFLNISEDVEKAIAEFVKKHKQKAFIPLR